MKKLKTKKESWVSLWYNQYTIIQQQCEIPIIVKREVKVKWQQLIPHMKFCCTTCPIIFALVWRSSCSPTRRNTWIFCGQHLDQAEATSILFQNYSMFNTSPHFTLQNYFSFIDVHVAKTVAKTILADTDNSERDIFIKQCGAVDLQRTSANLYTEIIITNFRRFQRSLFPFLWYYPLCENFDKNMEHNHLYEKGQHDWVRVNCSDYWTQHRPLKIF